MKTMKCPKLPTTLPLFYKTLNSESKAFINCAKTFQRSKVTTAWIHAFESCCPIWIEWLCIVGWQKKNPKWQERWERTDGLQLAWAISNLLEQLLLVLLQNSIFGLFLLAAGLGDFFTVPATGTGAHTTERFQSYPWDNLCRKWKNFLSATDLSRDSP